MICCRVALRMRDTAAAFLYAAAPSPPLPRRRHAAHGVPAGGRAAAWAARLLNTRAICYYDGLLDGRQSE